MPLGVGGNIMNMLFGDPEQSASDYANQQLAESRAAMGEDAQGNILPTPKPGAQGNMPPPGVGSGQIAPPMGAAPPGPGEPTSTQTPKSWGSVLMDLQRRDEASQGLNQSLGLGFAAFAQPRDREMVSKSFNVNAPNELATVQGMQNMGVTQAGTDRTQALGQQIMDPTAGPAMAQRLNISWDELKARYRADPAGTGNMIQQFAGPTDQMKNLQQIDSYMAQVQARNDPTKTPEVLQMIRNAMLAGMGGPDAEAAIGDAVAYKARTGKDAPWVANGSINQQLYKQYQTNEAQKETERGKASDTLATNINTAEELRTNLETLRESPGLQSILGDAVKREAALKAMHAANDSDVPAILSRYVLNDDEKATIATLRKITGASTESAMQSMAGTGTRVTQQEVGPLRDAISSVANLNQDYGSYVHGAINPFITKIKKTVANTYGASGNLNHMDPEYEPWLNDVYRPGGELFKEGGGADKIAKLQPVPANTLADAKKEATDYPIGKDDVLDNLQQQGFDVRRLRNLDPSKW